MAKKNFKKYLPKAGGTVAVAVAMTVALSAHAHAAEVDESDLNTGLPPVDAGSESGALENTNVVEATEANQEIESSNQETAGENEQIHEDNQQTDQTNDTIIQENEEKTDGELTDPDLYLPNAPETPETEGLDTEGYNEAIGEYNEDVKDYNEFVDDYNKDVDDYNDAAEEAEQQAQEDYLNSEAYQKYLADKAEWEAKNKAYQDFMNQNPDYLNSPEYQAYLADLAVWEAVDKAYQASVQAQKDYLNSEAYQAYLTAKTEWEAKNKAYQDFMNQNPDYLNSPEYQAYLADLAKWEAADKAYQDFLNNNEDYQSTQAYQDYLEDKAEYDQLVKENEIYDEVSDYNKGIKAENAGIEEQNAALENDVDGNAGDISEVGEVNKKLTLEEGVAETLNTYDTLVAEQAALAAQASELDQHPGKDAKLLGSDEYAAYLAAVEAYNTAVTKFNGKIDAYNAAVAKYNAAVNDYNTKQNNTTTSSAGEAQSTGTADWGNFAKKAMTFNHLDVRYHAAVVKDKEVSESGEVTYKNSYSKYDIIGVYYDEESAKTNPNQYGITYTDTDGKEVDYEMVKDNQHAEFATASKNWQGQIDRTDAEADKNTVVTFYATLSDGTGQTQGITIKLDKNSTYAENSYFKYDANDALDQFRDKDNKPLEVVTIDGVQYYNVSGQSVFLISALTCDGYGMYGLTGGYGSYEHLGGLDLVLNMETIIKIYQADKAKTVSYLDKELGKTAQADDPGDPGKAPVAPEVAEPGNKPAPPQVEAPGPAPVDETPQLTTEPGEKPTPPQVEAPGPAPVDETPQLTTEPGDKPTPPRVEKPDLEPTAPEAPSSLGRLEHVEKLEELAEKIIIEIEEPTDPELPENPIIPLDDDFPVEELTELPDEDVPLADAPEFVEILDEDVPLADAPRTGDASAVFGAMSAFSAIGMAALQLLGRKKRNGK